MHRVFAPIGQNFLSNWFQDVSNFRLLQMICSVKYQISEVSFDNDQFTI